MTRPVLQPGRRAHGQAKFFAAVLEDRLELQHWLRSPSSTVRNRCGQDVHLIEMTDRFVSQAVGGLSVARFGHHRTFKWLKFVRFTRHHGYRDTRLELQYGLTRPWRFNKPRIGPDNRNPS